MKSFRKLLSPEQRAVQLGHTIDPGFVNRRKIQTLLGTTGMRYIDEDIRRLPPLPDWELRLRINYIYTRIFLLFCNELRVKPLQNILASSLQDTLATQTNRLFCSTENFLPCPHVYDEKRCISVWNNLGSYPIKVELHYSTAHISADTLRLALYEGGIISVVAQLSRADDKRFIFEPLIMGFPYLFENGEHPTFEIMWHCDTFYEHFIEDFDEFSKVRQAETPASPERMRHISEAALKTCLAEILGDNAPKDWGGEQSDYFTAHIHLQGQRLTAAFLLKGPNRFLPMGLNHLGKNNDQIVRLSHEPAQILIVQHCHDITPAVRETLRAFAVQPSNSRRYCLIDGRDSLMLLDAYGLYDKALALSRSDKGSSE